MQGIVECVPHLALAKGFCEAVGTRPHWRQAGDQRRPRVPGDAAITRLVGAVLLEQDEHWQLEGRRMFSAESMAAIPALEELPTQPSLQDATA